MTDVAATHHVLAVSLGNACGAVVPRQRSQPPPLSLLVEVLKVGAGKCVRLDARLDALEFNPNARRRRRRTEHGKVRRNLTGSMGAFRHDFDLVDPSRRALDPSGKGAIQGHRGRRRVSAPRGLDDLDTGGGPSTDQTTPNVDLRSRGHAGGDRRHRDHRVDDRSDHAGVAIAPARHAHAKASRDPAGRRLDLPDERCRGPPASCGVVAVAGRGIFGQLDHDQPRRRIDDACPSQHRLDETRRHVGAVGKRPCQLASGPMQRRVGFHAPLGQRRGDRGLGRRQRMTLRCPVGLGRRSAEFHLERSQRDAIEHTTLGTTGTPSPSLAARPRAIATSRGRKSQRECEQSWSQS